MFLFSSFTEVTSGTVGWLALSPQLAGTFVGEICMFTCQRLSTSFFRLNGNSKLAIDVNISVNGGLSLC